MSYSFECVTCHACGCGVSLYNKNRSQVSRAAFNSKPEPLYCSSHLPQVITTLKDDQLLTQEQKRNLI